MDKTKTIRGFDYIEFTDYYGNSCSLQKSSLATKDCVWLGINDPRPKVLATQAKALNISTNETEGWVDYPIPADVSISTKMHLNREQVAELIPILQNFVETGDI